MIHGPVLLLPGPLVPAAHAVALLQGNEHAVGVYPRLLAELEVGRLVLLPAAAEGRIGPAEVRLLEGADLLKIHPAFVLRPVGRTVLGKQPALRQLIQVDVQLISCVGGVGLIRGVAEAQRVQGQNLPDLRAHGCQNVHKFIGFLAKAAHAVPGRQGADRHQNAAQPGIFLVHWSSNLSSFIRTKHSINSCFRQEKTGKIIRQLCMASF